MGRRPTTIQRNLEIVAAGNEYLFNQAKAGMAMKAKAVITHVLTLPCGHGLSEATIRQCLKAKLDLQKAHELARRNGAREVPRDRSHFKHPF